MPALHRTHLSQNTDFSTTAKQLPVFKQTVGAGGPSAAAGPKQRLALYTLRAH